MNAWYERRARQLFDRAMQLSPQERSHFLRNECEREGKLLAEVEALLEDHDSFTAVRGHPGLEGTGTRTPLSLTFDSNIGDYRILGATRHTPMGTVYVARTTREASPKHVTIRILNPSRVRAEVVDGFGSRCDFLSRIDHPGFARFVEAGLTGQGFPYVVTEFIAGEPLDRYCDGRNLSISDRLKLFLPVCAALQHAHSGGIPHGDLKPRNILVTADGTTRIIAHGLHLLDSPGDPDNLEKNVPSTDDVEYASPERCVGEPPCFSGDIYSLGAVLYEILSGHRPFRLSETGDFLQQPPLAPSAVIHRRVVVEIGKTSMLLTPERLARGRQTTVRQLERSLKADLDQMVLKALSASPVDRYTSPADLASEIECFLSRRPHSRRPSSILRRMMDLRNSSLNG